MPRKVEEIKESSIRPTARREDVYYRPAIGPTGRLEQIANNFQYFNANLSKFLENKRKKQEDLEIAQGVELFNQRLAMGENYTAEEMAQKAANGDYEGFKRLTKWQKEGIIRMRHKLIGESLKEDLLAWSETATIPDANGNPIPLSKVKDSNTVINAFYKKANDYINERTGGQYDPVLAQTFINNQKEAALNQFIQLQAEKRNQQIKEEYKTLSSQYLDNRLQNLIKEGTFSINPLQAGEVLYSTIDEVADNLNQHGITDTEITSYLSQYVQTLLRTTEDDDVIDKITALTLAHPRLQNDQEREQIKAASEYGHQTNHYRIEREREKERQIAEEQSWQYMFMFKDGKMTFDDMQKWIMQSPENAQAITNDFNAYYSAQETLTTMSPVDYRNLLIKAYKGGLSANQTISLLPYMNREQGKRLLDTVEAKQKIVSGYSNARGISKGESERYLNGIEKQFTEYLNADAFTSEVLKNDPRFNDQIMLYKTHEIYQLILKWQQDNPNADSITRQNAVNNIIAGVADDVKNNMANYNTGDYHNNQLKMQTKMYVAKSNTFGGNIADRFKNAVNSNDEQELKQVLREMGETFDDNKIDEILQGHRLIESDIKIAESQNQQQRK